MVSSEKYEGVKLLKNALTSKTVLTDVFLGEVREGKVLGLLDENKDMVSGLTKLYKSVENFDKDYIMSNHEKGAVLKPKSLLPFNSPRVSLLPVNEWSTKTYICTKCNATSTSPRTCCYLGMSLVEVEGGIVKGLVTYMVMDDLAVSPISTISSIALFHKYNIKDVGALEERVVNFGRNEGLQLLKHSLSSNTVLTNVFLGKK
ncbi:hypothetical protein CTI12_AA219090 [Artemisia annua]|uniref:Uncharacterized protein n=1 Tax=Artemisia annua TaxID=35608 RepID=A0A2U1NQW7_ARTAN|nr:hypothetical protein CTI12_AA219090 [Artemisia annua]